jgi:hypothetical protein
MKQLLFCFLFLLLTINIKGQSDRFKVLTDSIENVSVEDINSEEKFNLSKRIFERNSIEQKKLFNEIENFIFENSDFTKMYGSDSSFIYNLKSERLNSYSFLKLKKEFNDFYVLLFIEETDAVKLVTVSKEGKIIDFIDSFSKNNTLFHAKLSENKYKEIWIAETISSTMSNDCIVRQIYAHGNETRMIRIFKLGFDGYFIEEKK